MHLEMLYPFSTNRNLDCPEKWLISGLGYSIHKLTLKQLIMPERKLRFKTNKQKNPHYLRLGFFHHVTLKILSGVSRMAGTQ